MKKFLILAAAALMLPACDKGSSGGGEKAAIESFKAEIAKLSEWQEQNANPSNPQAAMDQMHDKMKAIKTDGLPADLKTAFDNATAALGKLRELMKDLPDLQKKAAADPALAKEFNEKMVALGNEFESAGEALKEAGKKHGIELSMDPKK